MYVGIKEEFSHVVESDDSSDFGESFETCTAESNDHHSTEFEPAVETCTAECNDHIIDFDPDFLEGCSVNTFHAETEIICPIDYRRPSGNNENLHKNMRKKLAYYFMNPLQKWKARRIFPWKLCLQIIKIIVVTVQLTLFGMNSYKYVQQHQDMTTALSRIFLEDWTAEVVLYPPSNGPYALYTIPEFYHHVNYVIRQYSKISTIAIGSYSYDSPDGSMTPLNLCIKWYQGGGVFPFNSTVGLLNKVTEVCVLVPVQYQQEDPLWDKFRIEQFLKENNFTINFRKLISVKLSFSLKTIFLKSLSKLDVPECYKMSLLVLYDNTAHDGQLPVSLKMHSLKLNCNANVRYENSKEKLVHLFQQILNGIVIVLCSFSTFLCSRSLHKGQMLRIDVVTFFKSHFNVQMTASEHFEFINLWYVMITISDILIICGSVAKINIEEQSAEGSHYSKCTILLGVGNLFIWVGLLQYLGFYPKYNMLILALKQALPNVMRFMVCAVLLYIGFCLCGWIVLGPYHIKFRSISSTSECLFSVMNGDDMFATFALINTKDNFIWWFSRLYLYTFIALFIYVVISLFISVIMDTFETIKRSYIHGSPPKTTVDLFLSYKLSPSVYI